MKRLEAGIFGLALGLRVWVFWAGLQEPFWYDEAYTWILSHRPLADLIAGTGADVHPPLYYLIVRLLPIGQPIETARLSSLVLSMAGLIMFALVLRQIKLSETGRLIALALMAVGPVQLHFSNELRQYALLQLEVIVLAWAVLGRRWWIAGIATTASMYTHNFGIVYAAILLLVGLMRSLREERPIYRAGIDGQIPAEVWRVILTGGISLVLYLPWAIYLPGQLDKVSNGNFWLQEISLGQAFYTLTSATLGIRLTGVMAPVMAMYFSGSLILVIWYSLKAKQFSLVAWGLGAWLIAAAISLLVTPLMHWRSFFAGSPAIFALYAQTIDRAAMPWRRVGMVMLGAVVGVATIYQIGMVASGMSKEHWGTPDPLYPEPAVHLEDTTLITWSAQGGRNFLLDAGCPEQLSALKPALRRNLGIPLIQISDLPARYTLVGWVSGLSSKCQEQLYDSLSADKTRLLGEDRQGYRWGVYVSK